MRSQIYEMAIISSIMSVCQSVWPSLNTEQLGSH